MTAKTQYQERLDLIERVGGIADTVTLRKNGERVFKRSYFYRHGRTVQQMAMDLKACLPKYEVVGVQDQFRTWPGESNFVVIMRRMQ